MTWLENGGIIPKVEDIEGHVSLPLSWPYVLVSTCDLQRAPAGLVAIFHPDPLEQSLLSQVKEERRENFSNQLLPNVLPL